LCVCVSSYSCVCVCVCVLCVCVCFLPCLCVCESVCVFPPMLVCVCTLQPELRFTALSLNDAVVPLVPGGENISVPFESRHEYLRLVGQARVSECDAQARAVARGLATQVPMHVLSLFTWQELELMVCGVATVDLALLKVCICAVLYVFHVCVCVCVYPMCACFVCVCSCLCVLLPCVCVCVYVQRCTQYGEGLNGDEPFIKHFWAALEGFTNEQRVLYLRFVWSRSRLPLTRQGFPRLHTVKRLSKEPADTYLPIGHTCFFSLDLPRYSSRQVCPVCVCVYMCVLGYLCALCVPFVCVCVCIVCPLCVCALAVGVLCVAVPCMCVCPVCEYSVCVCPVYAGILCVYV